MNRPSLESTWLPTFVLGATQGLQTELISKLGGLPWGFPIAQWPACEVCNNAMSHLAQLSHLEGVFDLGDEAAVLHVFHCETENYCDSGDYSVGASR